MYRELQRLLLKAIEVHDARFSNGPVIRLRRGAHTVSLSGASGWASRCYPAAQVHATGNENDFRRPGIKLFNPFQETGERSFRPFVEEGGRLPEPLAET
jgi:hypothetical protein